MSDLNKTTYLPEEMAEEIRGLKDQIYVYSNPLGSTVLENDVMFYDYDGTVLYSYTAEEFLELEEMPANPVHRGLTSEGWNWTLSAAKQHVSLYRELFIGETYTTVSGATRLCIELDEEHLCPMLCFYIGLSSLYPDEIVTATIDWGDGQEDSFNAKYANYGNAKLIETAHWYDHSGDYVISISLSTNRARLVLTTFADEFYVQHTLIADPYDLYRNNAYDRDLTEPMGPLYHERATWTSYYQNSVKRIELGKNVQIGPNGLAHVPSLESITISADTIFNSSDLACISGNYKLKCLIIPRGFTKLIATVAYKCYALEIISLPSTLIELQGCAEKCYLLSKIILPHFLRTMHPSFEGCIGLTQITLPASLSLLYPFPDLRGLTSIRFTAPVPPTIRSKTLEDGGEDYWSIPNNTRIYVPKNSLSKYLAKAEDYRTNYPSKKYYIYCSYEIPFVYADVIIRQYPYYTPSTIKFFGNGVEFKNGSIYFTGPYVNTVYHGSCLDTKGIDHGSYGLIITPLDEEEGA